MMNLYNIETSRNNQTFKCNLPNPFSKYTNMYLKKCSHDAFVREVKVIPEILEKVKEITIPVSKKRNVYAWDINPTNSNKYVIFLHGMAMNVSNYQRFYKIFITQ